MVEFLSDPHLHNTGNHFFFVVFLCTMCMGYGVKNCMCSSLIPSRQKRASGCRWRCWYWARSSSPSVSWWFMCSVPKCILPPTAPQAPDSPLLSRLASASQHLISPTWWVVWPNGLVLVLSLRVMVVWVCGGWVLCTAAFMTMLRDGQNNLHIFLISCNKQTII